MSTNKERRTIEVYTELGVNQGCKQMPEAMFSSPDAEG